MYQYSYNYKYSRAGAAATQRYFIDLNPSVNAYYLLATPIAITGNFEINYSATTTGVAMNFTDGLGIDSSGNFVSPASVTDIEVNGASVGLGAPAPLDGKLNNVKFIGLVSETITVVGQNGSGANYFDGILASVITPTTSFLLNEPTLNTEQSQQGGNSVTYTNIAASDRELFVLQDGGNWLSNELLASPSLGSHWTDDGGGSYTVDQPDGGFYALAFDPTTVGLTYRLSLTVNTPAGVDWLNVFGISSADYPDLSSAGDYVFTHTATSLVYPRFARRNGNGAFTQTVSNISLKQLLEVA